MNPTTIQRIAKWGKFTGIVTMICGAISALSGVFAFVVGAIPGLIIAWFGYLVYKTAEHASKYLHDKNQQHVEDILDMYGKLLKFYGIYMIFSVVLFFFMFIAFFGIIGAAMGM